MYIDVVAAFWSVERKRLVRRMGERKLGENLVGWTDSFMQERRVRMVIDGVESEELKVSTGLSQGSSVPHPVHHLRQPSIGSR